MRLERELNKKDSFYSCTHIFCSCIYVEIFCFSTKCLRNWCCCALEYFSVKVTKIFSSIRDKKVCSKKWTTCCQSSTKEEVKVTKSAGEHGCNCCQAPKLKVTGKPPRGTCGQPSNKSQHAYNGNMMRSTSSTSEDSESIKISGSIGRLPIYKEGADLHSWWEQFEYMENINSWDKAKGLLYFKAAMGPGKPQTIMRGYKAAQDDAPINMYEFLAKMVSPVPTRTIWLEKRDKLIMNDYDINGFYAAYAELTKRAEITTIDIASFFMKTHPDIRN